MPSNKVRTRFAPSPTGYMHVGNLRTALYTYLMAKHEGGTFILRIEDTDQGRYVEGAVDVIYNTLRETGLLWDEGPDVGGPVGPYVQSERMGMFKQYAEQLVAEGKAYYCFCTEERLEALHAEQRANGEMTHYDGCCRDLPKEEVEKRLAAGEPYVIRQKIPREGVTGFDDVVYGHIEVNNSEMDDQILIKTDGMPTYNFANVVDDHLMGITHVIRGSEYLSSTPKYNLLYQAFGWEIPTYIHCPPVMKDAQNKLSKRNGDASYQDLVAKGYLTEAVLNYICLLGWSPRGEYAEQEIFSLPELVKIWSPDGISKSPAIFDPLKLRAINAEYIRRLSPEEFQKKAEPWIDSAVHSPINKQLLCANLQPRCEVLGEIPEQLDFFDAMPDYDVSLYANKKQKTTPETAKEALEALLQAAVDPDAECDDREMNDWTGKTPLVCALEWGETEIAAMLLRAGANPDRRTAKGMSPFAVWIDQGCRVSDGMERFAPLMELFEQGGWHPDAPQTGKDERALMLACQHDDYELATWTLRRLLKQKVEVNARDAMGRTALMHLLGPHSAGPYQSEMLERLLEAGADPCAADNVGRTVLHYAAEGYTHAAARQAAELLFDFGRPDVSSADNEGRTPIDIAMRNNNESLVKFLLKHV